MTDAPTITVNFGKPMPLFPLEHAALLPQQVIPMHVFEDRYTQMVSRVLDGAGQIAMGVFEGDDWRGDYTGSPPIRPAVCVGQVVQHEPLPDGRYNLLVHGVCRAKVTQVIEPDGDRLYRRVMLEPLGQDHEGGETDGEDLAELRKWVARAIDEGRLGRLSMADQLLEYLNNEGVPDRAILDVLGFTLVRDPDKRYALLSEPRIGRRTRIVEHEIHGLDRLIRLAIAQHPEDWPKGLSWN